MWHKHRIRWLLGGFAIASLLVVLLLHQWNLERWSRQHPLCTGELRTVMWVGKNMEGANCTRQIFREANLSEANFRHANLSGADFSGAATRLIDTDLQGANLTDADLQYAQATRSNFSGANLRGANFNHANLNGAQFIGADLRDATFIGSTLIAANLKDVKHPPASLDRANLTDARLDFDLKTIRFCNAKMPDGGISKQGCLALSQDLEIAGKTLKESRFQKDWRQLEFLTASWIIETVISPEIVTRDEGLEEVSPQQIQSLPCVSLKALDQLWRQASGDRFGLSIQRKIWESPQVNQDYVKFGDVVGWKQKGRWLKSGELDLVESVTENEQFPEGYLPWHRWQVQEPTPEQPTRFRRVGFGQWMSRLKACGL